MPELTISAAQESLRSGELTARDLVEQCLDRIARYEGRVRAWVLVDAEGARAAAEECDRARRRGGKFEPLHGIPLGIKDIIDVAGWPTLAGSKIRAGHVAEKDADVVARLRKAGAIFLGKTVTTEFASFDPPPTRNPWNLDRTPGGSSSGSAAAVAMGMCLGALGSQTGGSITRPASYCGVAGCKPTYGCVSLAGIIPLAWHLDHPGPFARTAADLAILLDCIAGDEAVDLNAAQAVAAVDGGSPPRFGWLQGFFWETAEPPVRQVVAAALERVRASGAEVEKVALPSDLPHVVKQHRRIMAVEAAAYHRPHFAVRRADYGPKVASLIDEGIACSSLDYAVALQEQSKFRGEALAAMEPFDALLLPATTDAAPDVSTTGNPAFNSPWSCSGLPLVSLPCGLTSDGLPVSLQLIGRPNDEARLLAIAAWCERGVGFQAMPPLLVEDSRA